MKTVLALLLCLILPFQAVWSMAAQFCQHEAVQQQTVQQQTVQQQTVQQQTVQQQTVQSKTTLLNVADLDQPTLMTAHFGHHLHPAHAGDILEQPHAKQSSSDADLSTSDATPLSHDDHVGHFDCGLRIAVPLLAVVQIQTWLTYQNFTRIIYQSPLLTLPETPSWSPLATGGVAA